MDVGGSGRGQIKGTGSCMDGMSKTTKNPNQGSRDVTTKPPSANHSHAAFVLISMYGTLCLHILVFFVGSTQNY